MYKSDKMRVEDAIIPSLLEAFLLMQLKYMKESEKHIFDKALEMLRKDILAEIGDNNPKLSKRLRRLEGIIIDHCVSNGWATNKAIMLISHLASALEEAGALILGESTRQVLIDINDTIVKGYDDKELQGIKAVDISAAKQAPKILGLMKKAGYFI